MKLSDLNPFKLPSVKTLVQEEIEQLEREMYREDKLADYHRANATAKAERIVKLRAATGPKE